MGIATLKTQAVMFPSVGWGGNDAVLVRDVDSKCCSIGRLELWHGLVVPGSNPRNVITTVCVGKWFFPLSLPLVAQGVRCTTVPAWKNRQS